MFGLTRKIDGFVLTRDSWIWFYTKLVSFAGLVVSGVIDAKSLGLTEKQQHVLMMICGAVMAFAAQQSTSNLPSKSDADKVTLPVKEP